MRTKQVTFGDEAKKMFRDLHLGKVACLGMGFFDTLREDFGYEYVSPSLFQYSILHVFSPLFGNGKNAC